MINMGTSSVLLQSVDPCGCPELSSEQEMVDIMFSMLSASRTLNNIQKYEISMIKF